MEQRPTKLNLILRVGLTTFAIGALALVLLLAYNHGLEDTLPLVLYTIAWFAIPLGLLLCLIGAVISFVRFMQRKSTQV